MKRSVTLIGVLLMLLMVGNGCRFINSGRKDKTEHSKMIKHNKKMEFRQMRGMNDMRGGMRMGQGRMVRGGEMMGRPPVNGMRKFTPQGPNGRMRGNNWSMPMDGMRRGMGPMGFDRQANRQMGPGRLMANIPNLTDKQKKEIADLRLKQMDEMKKFRDESAAKMKSMSEANKAKMMNLLTDEQKKFIESRTGNNPSSAPAVEKNK